MNTFIKERNTMAINLLEYESIFGTTITFTELQTKINNKIEAEEYADVYEIVSTKLLEKKTEDGVTPVKTGSIFEAVVAKFNDEFDGGAYSNEQVAIAKGQFYASAYQSLENQANQSTFNILKTHVESDMLTANVSLVNRERDGFDDNLRIKEAEFNGQVAAFAVNANSSNMQDVVTRFNTSIDAITP